MEQQRGQANHLAFFLMPNASTVLQSKPANICNILQFLKLYCITLQGIYLLSWKKN